MEPPDEEEQWFPDGHMYVKYLRKQRNTHYSGERYLDGALVLGMKQIQRPDAWTKWQPRGPATILWRTLEDEYPRKSMGSWEDSMSPNRATVQWDPDFDLSTADAQTSFLKLCRDLREAPCAAKGCVDPEWPDQMVDPTSVECFLERMAGCVGDDWRDMSRDDLATLRATPCTRDPLPTGDAFYTSLAEFRNNGTFSQYDLPGFFDVNVDGLADDRGESVPRGQYLLWTTIRYTMTMREQEPPATAEDVYDEFSAWTNTFLGASPDSLKTAFPWTESAFRWMVTQRQLVSGMLTGFAICFPMAFVVVFIVAGSLRIALLATITVSCIVMSVLGMSKVALK